MRRGRPPHPELLTPREQEVLALLREGLSNQEIADRLGISRAGAAYHVGEILSKLDVDSRREAAQLEPELARRRVWGLGAFAGLAGKLRLESIFKATGILAIGAGVGAVALLAIGVGIVLLGTSEPSSLDCVTGDAAQNDSTPDGRQGLITGMTLDTIAEGEAFICLDVPQLPEVNGWAAHLVNVTRSHSLDYFDPGQFVAQDDGFRFLGINYLNPTIQGLITFDFTAYPVDYMERLTGGEAEGPDDCARLRTPLLEEMELVERASVRVRGHDAEASVRRDPARTGGSSLNLVVCWQEDELVYSAYARYGDPFDYRTAILPWLEQVE